MTSGTVRPAPSVDKKTTPALNPPACGYGCGKNIASAKQD